MRSPSKAPAMPVAPLSSFSEAIPWRITHVPGGIGHVRSRCAARIVGHAIISLARANL